MTTSFTPEQTRWLDEPISMLDLDGIVLGKLEAVGIWTVRQLLECCPVPVSVECWKCKLVGQCDGVRLLGIPGFGDGSLRKVLVAVKKAGFDVQVERR